MIFCRMVGMGMRFSKTCSTAVNLPPGGCTVKSKMAALRLQELHLEFEKIVQFSHEIYQIVCFWGQGIEL